MSGPPQLDHQIVELLVAVNDELGLVVIRVQPEVDNDRCSRIVAKGFEARTWKVYNVALLMWEDLGFN